MSSFLWSKNAHFVHTVKFYGLSFSKALRGKKKWHSSFSAPAFQLCLLEMLHSHSTTTTLQFPLLDALHLSMEQLAISGNTTCLHSVFYLTCRTLCLSALKHNLYFINGNEYNRVCSYTDTPVYSVFGNFSVIFCVFSLKKKMHENGTPIRCLLDTPKHA